MPSLDFIYLDHAAATPLSKSALQAMLPYFSETFFNPSAPYLPAKRVREAYETAKDTVAHVIGAKGTDLIMTAGATESINLAFTVLGLDDKALVLATEHAAVLETAKQRPYQTISVDRHGLIELDDLRQKIDDRVVLVSISLANNELGTIQPLAEISELLRKVRSDRLSRGIKRPIYLHSDASQALDLIDINVARLGADLLTLNSAKCGGPKGVGALYVGHQVRLQPLTFGGGQERGLRSGTENVPGVIGFAEAAKEAQQHLAYHRKKYQEMAQLLRRELAHTSIVAQNVEKVKHKSHKQANNREFLAESGIPTIPEPIFLGNPKHQLANFVPVCFPEIDAERIIYKLEAKGVLVPTGAACAANKGSKSHVLSAIGLSDAEIAGSLRISLGPTNDLDQIKRASQMICEAITDEYGRLRHNVEGVKDVTSRERIKERSADREERAPREDGRGNGSRKTSSILHGEEQHYA